MTMATKDYAFNAVTRSAATEARRLQKLMPWATVTRERQTVRVHIDLTDKDRTEVVLDQFYN